MELPLKRSFPIFHSLFDRRKIEGMKDIEKKILRGGYKSLSTFEEDLRTLLSTFAKAYEGERPEAAEMVTKIKEVYKEGKKKALLLLEPFILSPTDKSKPKEDGNEVRLPPFADYDASLLQDRVRCICGTFSEEGYMVQCEKCLVWQHCDCVGHDPHPEKLMSQNKKKKRGGFGKIEAKEEPGFPESIPNLFAVDKPKENSYYCELCSSRPIDPEIKIPFNPSSNPDQTFYVTLLRDDGLLLRKNDTVYVLREWPVGERFLPDGTERPRLTYRNAGPLQKEECDIFRIDTLWKDGK